MAKKLIYALSLVIVMSTISTQACTSNFWKYFTAAYWLPYTCGNQLELDAKKTVNFTAKQVEYYNLSKLVNHLDGDDFKKLRTEGNIDKTRICLICDREVFALLPKSKLSVAYLLPYTCGNQFKIDELLHKKNSLFKE